MLWGQKKRITNSKITKLSDDWPIQRKVLIFQNKFNWFFFFNYVVLCGRFTWGVFLGYTEHFIGKILCAGDDRAGLTPSLPPPPPPLTPPACPIEPCTHPLTTHYYCDQPELNSNGLVGLSTICVPTGRAVSVAGVARLSARGTVHIHTLFASTHLG